MKNKFLTQYLFCFRNEADERESPAAPPMPAVVSASAHESSTVTKRKKRLRKADTNVVSVKFDRLLQPGN